MKNLNSPLGMIVLFVILANSFYGQSDTNYVNRIWNVFDMGSNIGGANFLCEDFNGDGTEELIFSGGSGYQNDYLTIFTFSNNNYSSSWTSSLYGDNSIRVLQAANLDNDDDYEIYVVTENGDIEVFDGETMMLLETFSTNSKEADDALIADTDNDGNFEFIIVADDYYDQYLHIYDALTFELKYQTSELSALDVEVGDVDGDQESEIILSSGFILDGTTYETEWQYVGGFGQHTELGDTNEDGILEIISSTGSSLITAFDGAIHTPIWQLNTEYYGIDDLKVTDVENDGIYEILLGVDDWSTSIVCYNASTQQKLWETTDGSSGISKIGIGDPDNDGVKEFFWGSGVGSSSADYLHIAGFDYYQTEWISESLNGHFSVSCYDLDADDTMDIVLTPHETNNGYDGGAVKIYNGINHQLLNSFLIDNWYGVNCMEVGNINDSEQGEIVVAVSDRLYVYDGITNQNIWTSESISSIYDIELADVDNDNEIEIVVASGPFITVYNGKTFDEEWKSINTGTQIGGVEVENCDGDEALEIVFFNQYGIIQIYDGITHYLQWQSTEIDEVTAIDVKDYNQDGVMDIISGNDDGEVIFTRCDDFSISETLEAFNDHITGIEVANFDSTNQNEIFVGSTTLKIYNSVDFELLWEIENLGNYVGRYDNIVIADTDNDQYREVLFGTDWGVFQFETNTRYPDITPPKVVWEMPSDGMQTIGTNIPISALFSELIDTNTIDNNTISITDQDGSSLAKTINYNNTNNLISIIPENNLPVENDITVMFSASVADTAGNGLDGNFNGISEGSPDDDFIWSFSTGSGPDNIGPIFSEIKPDSYEKWAGIELLIEGTLTDYSDYASSPLTEAECFIDQIGTSGEGIKLTASDGIFNGLVEEVEIALSTENWEKGDHLIYFHGKDYIGNWGEFSEIKITVNGETPGSWTMYGSNPQHTGYNHFDSISLPLNLKWSRNISNTDVNPVCLVNDKVVVTTSAYNNYDEGIYVLDSESGETDWFELLNGSAYINPPSFAYGLIYFQYTEGSSGSYLRSYDITTGNMIWQSPYASQWEQHFAPTIANGRVFVNGGTYGGAYAFDAIYGHQYWFHDLPQYDNWTPAYHNDTVYTFTSANNSDAGYLAAINAQSGMLLWDKDDILHNWSGYSMGSAPVIDTVNRIILATSRSYLYAIDMDDQETLWYKTGYFVTPAVHNGKAYVANSNSLDVYDIQTGTHLWSYNAGAEIRYQPVISGNYVFISSNDDVHALNINDHTQKWHYNVGGHITVGLGQLFVASSETGFLYAFKEVTTSVDENSLSDNNEIKLFQNYPNPVSWTNSTTLSYYLPVPADIQLVIYDVHGVEVAIVEQRKRPAGKHLKTLNLDNFSPGIYFYKLIVNSKHILVKKLTVLE